MVNSLHEQLLKAGLVDEKQLQQANKDKQRKKKLQHHGKQKKPSETQQLAKQAMAREAERNRDLSRQRNAETQRKALLAQIKQLIESNRVDREEGEIPYNFSDGGKIRRLYVTERLQTQLGQGKMAIVKLGDGYEIVPATVAEKIRSRDADCVILLNEKTPGEDLDDPYASFKVPDDLMW